MTRKLKDFFKRMMVKLFHLGQRLGFDLLPRHFYSEIPAIYRLRSTNHWRQPYSLMGICGRDVDGQLAFVRDTVTLEIAERLNTSDVHAAACAQNGAVGYGEIEAEFLYAFVRQHRPERIIQIGCGVSTAVCLAAAEDAKYQPSVICIEPYPTAFLSAAAQTDQIRLIEIPVELIDLEILDELQSGDLLFVDSTHTLGPAGEVTRIVLEMLPRLVDGVFVHFHDIWLPYDFDPRVLDTSLFFWHETALLAAFLSLNKRFCIRTSLSLLHHQRPAELGEIFAHYQPMQSDCGVRTADGHYPSSIYLQVAPT